MLKDAHGSCLLFGPRLEIRVSSLELVLIFDALHECSSATGNQPLPLYVQKRA